MDSLLGYGMSSNNSISSVLDKYQIKRTPVRPCKIIPAGLLLN